MGIGNIMSAVRTKYAILGQEAATHQRAEEAQANYLGSEAKTHSAAEAAQAQYLHNEAVGRQRGLDIEGRRADTDYKRALDEGSQRQAEAGLLGAQTYGAYDRYRPASEGVMGEYDNIMHGSPFGSGDMSQGGYSHGTANVPPVNAAMSNAHRYAPAHPEVLRSLYQQAYAAKAGVPPVAHYAEGTPSVPGMVNPPNNPNAYPSVGDYRPHGYEHAPGPEDVMPRREAQRYSAAHTTPQHYAEGTPNVGRPLPIPGARFDYGTWGPPTPQPQPPVAFPAPNPAPQPVTFGKRVSASKGMVQVPGHDVGTDKVHAMLRPGEAVLVPGAAEEIGRHNIAALNMKHNAIEQAQGAPESAAGGPEAAPAPKTQTRGMPAAGGPRKPAAKSQARGPHKLAHGTHEVKAGGSAKTPKITPAQMQALAGVLGGGGGAPFAPVGPVQQGSGPVRV